MNITYLNTWVGKQSSEYTNFLKEKLKTEDIFCFQEIASFPEEKFSNHGLMLHQWELTRAILEDFVGFHAVRQRDWYDFYAYEGVEKPVDYGSVIFVRKNIPILEYREKFILGHQNSAKEEKLESTLPVVIQAIKIQHANKDLWVINFHGYYAGKGIGKGDTEERITQSEELSSFIKSLSGEVILGGDFNLNPDTKSIQIIESTGLENLISKYEVQTTRTSLYPKEKFEKWQHADYVFVSKDIEVLDFKVDTNSRVSDHTPMFLKIK